jgi:hypothetical protein
MVKNRGPHMTKRNSKRDQWYTLIAENMKNESR